MLELDNPALQSGSDAFGSINRRQLADVIFGGVIADVQGYDSLGQDRAQFDSPLIQRVYLPHRALCEDDALVSTEPL